ncbi:uncharacterized protein LOC134072778 isoform X2 [Sardina pilchardus]|uniref:uncharacterized protein LOC134072778 isoform X2 n=1 Tax=Sardina pilchardus TaxID=27697 RepID=UPI002E127B10
MGNHAGKANSKPTPDGVRFRSSRSSIKGTPYRRREDGTDLLDVKVAFKLTEHEGHHSRQGSKKSTISACVEIPYASVENQENDSDEAPESVFQLSHENQKTFCRSSIKRTREESTDLDVEVSIRLCEPEQHHRQGSKKSTTSACAEIPYTSVENQENVRRAAGGTDLLDVDVSITLTEAEGCHSRQGSKKSEQPSSRQGSKKVHKAKGRQDILQMSRRSQIH